MASSDKQPEHYQNVIVMRHGDRIDNFVPLWAASASRPWDPPLTEDGRTAHEAVSSLCAVANHSDDPNDLSSNGVVIDPSKIKVAIEYGLCEVMNSLTIRDSVAPKDGVLSFDLADCEAALPAGTLDRTAEMIYNELPRWEETVEDARSRYLEVIKTLADKYPSENLLIVTHGEGVGAAVAGYYDDLMAYEVEYCAYSVSRRPVVVREKHLLTAGEFVGSPRGLVGVDLMKAPVDKSS